MMNLIVNGYTFEKEIGVGSFATTYSAIHQKTGSKVCIKVFDKSLTSEDSFINEVDILEKLSHPCIASLDSYFQDRENYYIVMEYAKGETLLNYINRNQGVVKLSIIRRVSVQLVSVIYYLHNIVKIVHRDIKLENIIIDGNYNIKLIDFGLSKELDSEHSLMNTLCGSQAYIAPEFIGKEQYTNAADIWSLGVVIYALAVGALPFYDLNTDKMYYMIQYQEPFFPNAINEDLRKFVCSLLTKDQAKRPSAADLLNAKFIAETLDKKLLDKNLYRNYTWSAKLSGSGSCFYSQELEKLGIPFSKTCEKLLSGINDESTTALKIICTAKEDDVQKQEETARPFLSILAKKNKLQLARRPDKSRNTAIFVPRRKAGHLTKKSRPIAL